MSRVEPVKIESLTFYKDSYTASERTYLLQLVFAGKPEVVRCVSLGGTGTEGNWKVWDLFFSLFLGFLLDSVFLSAKQTFLTLCDWAESRSPVKDGRDQGILIFWKVYMVYFYLAFYKHFSGWTFCVWGSCSLEYRLVQIQRARSLKLNYLACIWKIYAPFLRLRLGQRIFLDSLAWVYLLPCIPLVSQQQKLTHNTTPPIIK